MTLPIPKRSLKLTMRERRADDRMTRIGEVLDRVRRDCDERGRFAADPVSVVHRYHSLHDREIVGLLASSVAFGNAKAFRAKIDDALGRLGPDPALACDAPTSVARSLHDWRHRVYRGEDLSALLIGARLVQRQHGSLGALFSSAFHETGSLFRALVVLTDQIRAGGGLSELATRRRGAAHILPDPRGKSGCKRMLLFLRWMIRPCDGVDLGLWDVPASALLIPVDTHIHKLSRNLGLTARRSLGFDTVEEITAALRRFDPTDPVKYDFALCHLGMLQRCPSRRDEVRCDGCGIRSVCRHWEGMPQ